MKEIEIELDGIKVKAQENENLLEVSLKNGRYIPHFCYHKKLSIAANCRMCLVEIEKSPKPMPACATKIMDGMKVFTNSKLASDAQKGVMEFLLINHPLDCPICDQGGECQLQDLAMDYGKDATRFEEEKRVVIDENLGSLIQTNMTRCIQCSRCVRFTDEIAGYQELGMYYRNNHVRVMSFLERSLDSEISGNVIDLCPVGALTSKPFLYKARNWELSRRKSISSHDSLGSNLLVNIDKYYKVVRVLPLENEEINECWISDRDRFAYNGLYSEQRALSPMVKQDGKWQDVSWETAIEYVSRTIYQVIQEQGKDNIGVIASPNSTLEELYLLQKLMLTLGIENLDHRINQTDF
jgi:NADH-quinone oxidoreductase subunit G